MSRKQLTQAALCTSTICTPDPIVISNKNAHTGNRTPVTSMEGLYDATTLCVLLKGIFAKTSFVTTGWLFCAPLGRCGQEKMWLLIDPNFCQVVCHPLPKNHSFEKSQKTASQAAIARAHLLIHNEVQHQNMQLCLFRSKLKAPEKLIGTIENAAEEAQLGTRRQDTT